MAVHPDVVASTRLRVVQYEGSFEQAGIDLVRWSFLRREDLPIWFGRSQVRRALCLMAALVRLPRVLQLVRGCSVVIIQREALPLGPPIVELVAGRRRKIVWDVDDAVWESFASPTAGRVPRWVRATAGKYQRLCRRADEVWAGSDVLATWCRQHSARVHVIPTVVSVPPVRAESCPERSVGWVGSHSTAPFLEQVLPSVALVQPPPMVLVVGAAPDIPRELAAQVAPWSQQAEDDALSRTRVGLYPVDREHSLAEGKCGLKAILYMAHGIPCVITPTTTNAAVVRDGAEGLHADTAGEWTEQVQRLLDDEVLWERLSLAAHRRAREHYSLEVWGPRVARRLSDLAMRI